jgi:DNA-binding transcriptional LysR family regulator
MNVSLDRLQVLDVLLRTRSPSLAARELGVTQSAVSKVLGQLRVQLHDQLLIRRGDAMVPTPRAERLATSLSAPLARLRKLMTGGGDAPSPAVVTIAMRDQFAIALGPEILRRLSVTNYSTELRVAQYERSRLADDLARGAIDVAIAVDPPAAPGLMSKLLYRESFVCLTPKKKPPTLEDYLSTRHIATTAHAGHEGVDAALARLGRQRDVVARVPYFAAAIQLAEALGLYVTVPRRVARAARARGLIAHPVPFPLSGFSALMVWDQRCADDADNRWVRTLITDVARRA